MSASMSPDVKPVGAEKENKADAKMNASSTSASKNPDVNLIGAEKEN